MPDRSRMVGLPYVPAARTIRSASMVVPSASRTPDARPFASVTDATGASARIASPGTGTSGGR